MDSDELDLRQRNIVGAIDRLTTNIALALIAIIPSLVIVVVMPWRLRDLIISDPPDGRDRLLLAPGVYFLLVVVISLLILAFVVPEAAGDLAPDEEATATLGISSANTQQILAAWRAGDVNAMLISILPIFLFTAILSASTWWLKILVGDWWTMRATIRTGFYILGSVICIGAVIVIGVSRADFNVEQLVLITNLSNLSITVLVAWWYFWVFKDASSPWKPKRLAATALAIGSVAITSITLAILIG
ncbi:MAG: hypothetical protein AAFQ84_04955 [Pseudomonadota bacterium]